VVITLEMLLVILKLFTSQLETHKHKEALALIETLLVELKRIDDKMILTEVHLLESRVHRGIGNFAKAKVPPHFYCILLLQTAFSHRPRSLLRVRLPIQFTAHLLSKPHSTYSLVFSMQKTRITPLHTRTSMRHLRG
jgi:hypothetical protein